MVSEAPCQFSNMISWTPLGLTLSPVIPWQNWEEGGRQEGEGAVRRRKKLSKAKKSQTSLGWWGLLAVGGGGGREFCQGGYISAVG